MSGASTAMPRVARSCMFSVPGPVTPNTFTSFDGLHRIRIDDERVAMARVVASRKEAGWPEDDCRGAP